MFIQQSLVGETRPNAWPLLGRWPNSGPALDQRLSWLFSGRMDRYVVFFLTHPCQELANMRYRTNGVLRLCRGR